MARPTSALSGPVPGLVALLRTDTNSEKRTQARTPTAGKITSCQTGAGHQRTEKSRKVQQALQGNKLGATQRLSRPTWGPPGTISLASPCGALQQFGQTQAPQSPFPLSSANFQQAFTTCSTQPASTSLVTGRAPQLPAGTRRDHTCDCYWLCPDAHTRPTPTAEKHQKTAQLSVRTRTSPPRLP